MAMATRIRLASPLVVGETSIDAITLRDLRCGDLFRAAREISDGGSGEEMKNRAAAIAAGLPFAATRAVPLAVQAAFEAWWSRQWARPAPDLPATVREPVAGDWFDAHAAGGGSAGVLETEARVYCLCADLTLDHLADLPPSALDAVSRWYDARSRAAVAIEEIEEVGLSTEDPSLRV